MGYGLGDLFRSLPKAATPMVKKGAKALGEVAMTTRKNLFGDIHEGKNPKEAGKSTWSGGSWCCKEQGLGICAAEG